MFRFNVKWTTAESSLFHFALSLLVSVIMSVLVASAQYLTSGRFNLQELGVIAAAAFVGSFSRGIISLESNPNLMPAILDAVKQLQTVAAQQPTAPFAPYVTIHTGTPPQVEPPAAQPSIRSLNAFQVPPRPIAQPPIQMPVVQQPAVDIAQQNTASQPVPPQVVFAERSFSQPLPVVGQGQ